MSDRSQEEVPLNEHARKRCNRCGEIKRNCLRNFGYRRKGKGWSTNSVCKVCQSAAVVRGRAEFKARRAGVVQILGALNGEPPEGDG